jgi:protease-4
MRKFLGTVFIVIIVFFFAGCLLTATGIMKEFHIKDEKVSKASILFLHLDGVIIDGQEFLDDLKKYASDPDIKGVLVQINSPGGVVGPSQELYAELKRVRTELKKPVVVSCLGLTASGGYYVAVAADKIITNPGALLGSIGVIMEFANLEKLYDWAKIKRYSIKTGAYKDSGAEYRDMREDERALFQEMANEVLLQFKKTVAEGRKLAIEKVSQYADGRVFTGATAVTLGFADQVGTLEDAKRVIGQLAGLGLKPEIFTPPGKRPDFLEYLSDAKSKLSLDGAVQGFMGTSSMKNLWGQPLYLMSGVLH